MSQTPPRRQTKTVTDPGRQSQLDCADGGERSDSAIQVDSDRNAQVQVVCGEEASVWAGDVQVEYPGGGIHRSFSIQYVDEWPDGGSGEGQWRGGGGEIEGTLLDVYTHAPAKKEVGLPEREHDWGRAQGLKPTRIVHNATPFAWGLPVARVCGVCGVCVCMCVNMCVCQRAGAHMQICV